MEGRALPQNPKEGIGRGMKEGHIEGGADAKGKRLGAQNEGDGRTEPNEESGSSEYEGKKEETAE